MEINFRRMKKQDLIKDIPPEKVAELQKAWIDLEKFRIGKQLDGESLKSIKETQLWLTLAFSLLFMIFLGVSVIPAIKEVYLAKYKQPVVIQNTQPIIYPLLKP